MICLTVYPRLTAYPRLPAHPCLPTTRIRLLPVSPPVSVAVTVAPFQPAVRLLPQVGVVLA